jgi:transcriptional regulator with XRE-family HTH domain
LKGLEYILALYNIQHVELADKLGIKKQNINMWIKGKQKISQKYLPILSQIYGIEEQYFQKDLDEIDKLVIQKEKLKKELKAEVVQYEDYLEISENTDLIGKPVYDAEVINEIDKEISKAKVLEDFRAILGTADKDHELNMFQQLNMLLKLYKQEKSIGDTIDGLSHFYGILPEWVGDPESSEFEVKFTELLDEYYNEKQ